LDGEYHAMSTTVNDQDGGWWKHVISGLGVHSHLEHKGKVIATVDIVFITKSGKVLLIKRGKSPFKDHWAFPGGRIEEKDHNLLEAAKRELAEETNITNVPLTYVTTIGNNQRDPRGFCLTNVFAAKVDVIPENVRAGDDAIDYDWFDIMDLPDMAFDHKDILKTFLSSQ